MTYSIVARDPDTGELGVAVQTAYFAVGTVVQWAEPGVGAVATQSFTEISYGPLGLDLMRGGKSAPDSLAGLLAADSNPAMRQVAMVDAGGNAAVHTGDRCVEACGHLTGDGVTVQANMMERDTVWRAMLEAYRSAPGPLAERLLAALQAAEAEGGDMRGRQSAALLVVPAAGPRWQRSVDLRVDDHPHPVPELGRLLYVHRAYEALGEGNDLAGRGDVENAAVAHRRAHSLAPDDPQVAFWAGLSLMAAGDVDRARALLEQARLADPRWAPYLRRVAASGLFPSDPALLDALLPLEP